MNNNNKIKEEIQAEILQKIDKRIESSLYTLKNTTDITLRDWAYQKVDLLKDLKKDLLGDEK